MNSQIKLHRNILSQCQHFIDPPAACHPLLWPPLWTEWDSSQSEPEAARGAAIDVTADLGLFPSTSALQKSFQTVVPSPTAPAAPRARGTHFPPPPPAMGSAVTSAVGSAAAATFTGGSCDVGKSWGLCQERGRPPRYLRPRLPPPVVRPTRATLEDGVAPCGAAHSWSRDTGAILARM